MISRTLVWGTGWETRDKKEAMSNRYFAKMVEYSQKRMSEEKVGEDKRRHYTETYMKQL